MANIAIVDTGYLTITASSGTQATMANSGSAINLKTVDITYGGGSNVDDSPVIGPATWGTSNASLNVGSHSNAKITVSGVMSRTNTDDMDLLTAMNDLRKTIGIKILYYTSSTDGYREVTDSVGAVDAYHLSGTIPHIHVRVTDFTVRQTSDSSIVRYTLEMIETA